MRPISVARWLSPSVAVEQPPLSRGLVTVFRGVLLEPVTHEADAGGYRENAPGALEPIPVIVRVLDDDGEDSQVHEIFLRVTATRKTLEGSPAPRIFQTLGREGKLLASVEEYLVGVPVSSLLARLRDLNQTMPPALALGILRPLASIWRLQTPGTNLSRLSLDPGCICLEASGRVRVLPIFEEERSRQAVGAAILHFDEAVAYMSPEQIAGNPADEYSSMFVLGLLLYELLAGHHPLRGQGQRIFDVVLGLTKNAIPSLWTRRADLHPAVVTFVHRCLAPSPAERFDSWHDLDAALAGLQAIHEPVGNRELAAYVRSILGEPPREPTVRWSLESQEPPFLHPISLPDSAPRRIDATPIALELLRDALYAGNDARPMFAVSPALFVDARPVTRAELERFLIVTGQPAPPYLPPIGGLLDDAPCVHVPIDLAEKYARWAGKRLPTEGEWVAAVTMLGAGRLGTGAVWEWTQTRSSSGGHVVRGGRWRDQPGSLPSPEHRSFATESGPDLGFRCVMDRSE